MKLIDLFFLFFSGTKRPSFRSKETVFSGQERNEMEATGGDLSGSNQPFPAVDVRKELNPGQNKKFEVDSVSSQVAASKEIKVLFHGD